MFVLEYAENDAHFCTSVITGSTVESVCEVLQYDVVPLVGPLWEPELTPEPCTMA
jgi:hypothetical protein